MKTYRKKPLIIEAEQWVGSPREMPIPPVPSQLNLVRRRKRFIIVGKKIWQLKTLEGWYNLTPYDWIIRGIKGEYYPCKPDIFEATYEEVSDSIKR